MGEERNIGGAKEAETKVCFARLGSRTVVATIRDIRRADQPGSRKEPHSLWRVSEDRGIAQSRVQGSEGAEW